MSGFPVLVRHRFEGWQRQHQTVSTAGDCSQTVTRSLKSSFQKPKGIWKGIFLGASYVFGAHFIHTGNDPRDVSLLNDLQHVHMSCGAQVGDTGPSAPVFSLALRQSSCLAEKTRAAQERAPHEMRPRAPLTSKTHCHAAPATRTPQRGRCPPGSHTL